MINFIQLTEQQFTNMMQSAAYMGALTALKHAGVAVKDEFTLSAMYRMHGRKRIDRLVRDGKLTPRNVEGSKNKLYSEQEYQSLIV